MAASNRVSIQGTLGTAEVWSINPHFSGTSPVTISDYAELKAWADAIAALNGGHCLPGEFDALFSSAVTTTKVRVEALGADGSLVQAAESSLSPSHSGTGTPAMPPQTSLVMTLQSDRPGRSYTGRSYLPALGASINSTSLRVNLGTLQSYADAYSGWLQDVADAAPGSPAGFGPVVVSTKMDLRSPVTAVRAGDVLDTQRRRRDALIEQYVTSPVG